MLGIASLKHLCQFFNLLYNSKKIFKNHILDNYTIILFPSNLKIIN